MQSHKLWLTLIVLPLLLGAVAVQRMPQDLRTTANPDFNGVDINDVVEANAVDVNEIYGGTGSGDDLTIRGSTQDDGDILLNPDGGNVGVGITPVKPLHIDGSIRMERVDVPAAPTVAILAEAGNLNGNYRYRISYVCDNGETEVGTNSSQVSPATQKVTVTLPIGSNAHVTGRKIWRTVAGGAFPYETQLVATVADNTTATYVDNIADGSLGVDNTAVNTTAQQYINGDVLGDASTLTTFYGIGSQQTKFLTSAFGYYCGNDNTGMYFTGTGFYCGQSNTGSHFTGSGIYCGQSNTGERFTGSGTFCGQNNTGVDFTGSGFYCGNGNTGASFTGSGIYCGQSNTGTSFTGSGIYCGQSNTGASFTGSGYSCGQNNTGANFTGSGYSCGQNNTGASFTGSGIFCGRNNTGDRFTGSGYSCGNGNTGDRFTGSGYACGNSNDGARISAFGYEAGGDNSGDDGVFLGYQAGKGNATDNQFIVKQGNINATPLIQGDFSSGNVGIGTTDPGNKLDLNGSQRYRNTTAPASSPADCIQLYAEDVNSSSELKVRDEAGNITVLSANVEEYPDDMAVSKTHPYVKLYSRDYVGIDTYIAETRMAELVQELSRKAGLLKPDEYIVKTVPWDPNKIHDWDAEQVMWAEKHAQDVNEYNTQLAELDARIADANDPNELAELKKERTERNLPELKIKKRPKWL